MKKVLILTAVAALTLLGAFSCRKKAEVQAPRKIKIVLDWTPNTNHTGLYAAQQLGYFREAGLEVEIIQPGQNSAEQIVASGNAQFGVSYQESVIRARVENIPLVSLAAVIQHNTSGFASLKDTGITRPKHFEGRRYGSSGWPSDTEIPRSVMAAGGTVSRTTLLPASLISALRWPLEPTGFELRERCRLFPPDYLHASWRDFLYWDSELDPF